MILIDFNQIAIGGLMTQIQRTGDPVDYRLVCHVVFNTIRYYRQKFKDKYGEVIICCDSRHYWRRDYFPNYKINRKKDRAASDYDWPEIFSILNRVKDELKDNFPYKVLEVYGAEADDIIAIVLKERKEPISIIISSDKDFIQLHTDSVDQFSPVSKRMINGTDPKKYIREHIIKGDRSDGVPNILSPDDTFVTEKRQKPIRKTVIQELVEQMDKSDPLKLHTLIKCPKDTWIRNWQRNETLIDLKKIPDELKNDIVMQFDRAVCGKRDKLFNYFVTNKLQNLMENIGDF